MRRRLRLGRRTFSSQEHPHRLRLVPKNRHRSRSSASVRSFRWLPLLILGTCSVAIKVSRRRSQSCLRLAGEASRGLRSR